MTGGKLLRVFCCLLVFISDCPLSAGLSVFNGRWEGGEKIDDSGKPYSILDLSLTEGDAGKLRGAYCFVTQYGNRVDCSPEGDTNISGRVAKGNPKKAIANFNTFFGAQNGVAELEVNEDGSVVWSVIVQPRGGGYFGPDRAVLRRVAPVAPIMSTEADR